MKIGIGERGDFFTNGIGGGNGFLEIGTGGRGGLFKIGTCRGNGFLEIVTGGGGGFFKTEIGGGNGFSKTGIDGGNGFSKIGVNGGRGFLKIGTSGGSGFLKMGMRGFLKIGMLNFPSSWTASSLNSSLWDFISVVTRSPVETNAQDQDESFKLIRWNNEIRIQMQGFLFCSLILIGLRDKKHWCTDKMLMLMLKQHMTNNKYLPHCIKCNKLTSS